MPRAGGFVPSWYFQIVKLHRRMDDADDVFALLGVVLLVAVALHIVSELPQMCVAGADYFE